MVRTMISAFITLALLLGVSFYEANYVQHKFQEFYTSLHSLKRKAELGTVSYTDGLSIRAFWDDHKITMHVWIPHTVLYEIDYQLDEAIGFIYAKDLESALPKIEVLLGLSENVPKGYTLTLGNIF